MTEGEKTLDPRPHETINASFFMIKYIAQIISLAVITFFTVAPNAFAQLTRLKTSYSALTANMAAYWLAKEAKIFEKHGLNVDVVLIESGVTTVQALTAGETQIAMGGGIVGVSSNLAGSDIVSFGGCHTNPTHLDGRKGPTAKAAKPEQFIDDSILREIEKSGFVNKLHQQK
jgi:ABC-type nitrate/sulfonate/bicarbonate transport system substrate-binding protein